MTWQGKRRKQLPRCQNVAKMATPPYRCFRCERTEHPFSEMCVVDVDGELCVSESFVPWLLPLGYHTP